MSDQAMPRLRAAVSGTSRGRAERSTSPVIWATAVLLLGFLLCLRLQQLYDLVVERTRTAPSPALQPGGDPAVLGLAVNIGAFLGVLLSVVLAALYLSLASVAESTLLPGVRLHLGRFRLGVLGAASIASLLGLQLMSVLGNIPSPKDRWFSYAFVIAVGIAVPFLFKGSWTGRGARVRAWVFGSSVAVAAISLLF